MDPYFKNRVSAYRRLLNPLDIVNFDRVPDHIVGAFFGPCTYKKKMQVATFCIINGISDHSMYILIHWTDIKSSDKYKLKGVYDYLSNLNSTNRHKYYSYDIQLGRLVYVTGEFRKYGHRVLQ